MKKYFILLMAAMVGFSTMSAQSAKEIKKNSAKIAKQKLKQGWEPINATYTLDVLMNKYNSTLEADPDNRVAIIGNAIGTMNVKVGKMNATNAGINEYSSRVAAEVKGKVKSVMASDANSQTGNAEEIDKFGAAFESSVKNKITGLVQTVFCIRKQEGQGYRYEVYMYIDKAKAKADAIAAAKEALAATIAKEAKDAVKLQSLSDQVADFMGDAMSGSEE